MNLRRTFAIARKEWWHLLRDPQSLAMILFMPAMLLFLFGYAIRLDVQEAPLGVLQESHDGGSNELIARFNASRAFNIVAYYGSREELRDSLAQGKVWGALVIPASYPRDLAANRGRVQLLLDGVDANSARLVRNYALGLVDGYARELSGSQPPLQLEERTWFNEAVESRLAIVPGVIAVVMAVIGALMTSLTVAREMESGSLALLATTPLTRSEFLLGKLAPYFIIGLLDVLVAAACAVWLFDVPLRAGLLALMGVSSLFLLVVMLQGTLISINAGNQMLASQIALVATFLPAFLLSGFIFAIDNMPFMLHYITLAVPARYYVTLSKAIFLKGISPFVLWADTLALTFITLLLAGVVLRRAKRLGLSG